MPSLPDKIYSWKKKIIVSDFETCLSKVTARREDFGRGEGRAGKVTRCSPPSRPLPIWVQGWPPVNFSTVRHGREKQGSEGRIYLGEGLTMYLWKYIWTFLVEAKLMGDRVNRGKSKGCVWWTPFIESHWNPYLYCIQFVLNWEVQTSSKYSFKNNKYDNDRSQSKYLLFSRIFVLLGESVGWIDVERVLDLVGLAAATLCIRSIK